MPSNEDTQDIMKRLSVLESSVTKLVTSIEHLVDEMHALRIHGAEKSKDAEYLSKQVNNAISDISELEKHNAGIKSLLDRTRGAIGVVLFIITALSGALITGFYDVIRLEKRVSILEIQLQKQADNKVNSLRRTLDCNEKGCPKPPDADTEPKPLPLPPDVLTTHSGI